MMLHFFETICQFHSHIQTNSNTKYNFINNTIYRTGYFWVCLYIRICHVLRERSKSWSFFIHPTAVLCSPDFGIYNLVHIISYTAFRTAQKATTFNGRPRQKLVYSRFGADCLIFIVCLYRKAIRSNARISYMCRQPSKDCPMCAGQNRIAGFGNFYFEIILFFCQIG